MRTIQIILASIIVCASIFGLAFTSYAASGSKASDVTDATFSDIIMNVGADETERNVTWYSNYNTTGEVQYAKSNGTSFPMSYSRVPARVTAANEDGSYVYKATMVNLEPNTTYVYRLVTGSSYSKVKTFKVNEFGDEFSFIYVADSQTGSVSYKNKWISVLDSLNANFPTASLLVSGGDQIASPTAENDYSYFITDHLASIAVSTTNGPAHDNAILFRDHYNLPNQSSNYGVTTTTSDYHYTYNNVLFVHFNVESKSNEEHIEYLERAILNNPDTVWTVVVMHFSLFSGGSENHSAMGNALVGRMNELGVDIVLSGHDHYYVRSELMKDYNTESGDTVVGNTVTNPTGTLFVCADTATGEGNYTQSRDHHTALYAPNPTKRLNAMVFEVTETSLSFKAYYLDGSSPEVFDEFTINRTAPKVRVNSTTAMLELLVDGERKEILNAYGYTNAIAKVVDGMWSVSTNGGASYTSLDVAATSAYEKNVILSIDKDGYWQFSENGGASYEKLIVNVNYYTVIYKTDTDVAPGAADVMHYYLVGQLPDPPAITLPSGSFAEGVFYDWSYKYCDLNGNEVTSFEPNATYIAQLVYTESDIITELLISRTPNESAGIYTWDRAWEIAFQFPDTHFTFKLAEDMIMTSADALEKINLRSTVTIDLAGYTLDSTAVSRFLDYYGSGGSGTILNVITSEEGGTIKAKAFVHVWSNHQVTMNFNFGSKDSYPIYFEAISGEGYIVSAGGNFKRQSILNLNVENGIFRVNSGIVHVDNVSNSSEPTEAGKMTAANYYYINIKDSTINFTGNQVVFIEDYARTKAASYINATNVNFISEEKVVPFFSNQHWYGSLAFDKCLFQNITFTTDKTANVSGASFSSGCKLINATGSFNSTGTAFANSKFEVGLGCQFYIDADENSVLISSKPNGKELVLRVNNGYIQWQYEGDEEWNDFADISTLIGEGGINPELRVNKATDEWEITYNGGDTWTSLGVKATVEVEVEKPVPTPVVPELRINEETDEWEASYDGGSTWQSLGIKATVDGEAVEPMLRANEETNEWEVSYDNGESWISLGVEVKVEVEVEVEKPVPTPVVPELRVNEETGEWEVSYDGGETWQSLGIKAELDGGNDVQPEPQPVKKGFFARLIEFFRNLFGGKKKKD